MIQRKEFVMDDACEVTDVHGGHIAAIRYNADVRGKAKPPRHDL